MAGAAIIVDTTGKLGVRSALIVARLMLMVMMTKVFGPVSYTHLRVTVCW